MMTLKSLKSLILIATASVTFNVLANHPIFLGAVSLMDRQDTDVLHLPPCMGPANNPVSSLKLEVKQYAAQIDDLDVTFYNGDKQDLTVREHFAPGSSSRWIDLNGGKRCIKKIVIKGDSDTFGNAPFKQAKVLFYGL